MRVDKIFGQDVCLLALGHRLSHNSSLSTFAMNGPETNEGAEDPDDCGTECEGLSSAKASTEPMKADLIPLKCVTVAC